MIIFSLSLDATVSLSDWLYESGEDEGAVTVCAVLVDGELERVVTVYLSTDDATAVGKKRLKWGCPF
jgi:hypothetical protein